MQEEQVIPVKELENDLATNQMLNVEIPTLVDNDFDEGFDLFDEEFGGSESGIEDLYRIKFNAGINENVKFLGLEWQADENYKMIRVKFENHDGWEDTFPMFIPEARTYMDDKTKTEITTWFPQIMKDSNKQPLDDSQNKRRAMGGVPILDDNGRPLRNKVTRKLIYRNESEAEAKIRQMKDFKMKLNSFLAPFCRDNMKNVMTHISAKGRVTGWLDYMERIMDALNTFSSDFATKPLRLKLHRKYDKSTSNKRSEKYFELPKDMSYGLFIEQMCPSEMSVLTTSAYEDKNLIAAPSKQNNAAGLMQMNSPSGLATGLPMGGNLPQAQVLPQSTAMPAIRK